MGIYKYLEMRFEIFISIYCIAIRGYVSQKHIRK